MSKLLDKIDSPNDLRKLDHKQLPQVADEVRELILNVISKVGGHLSSNLGAVELAVACHYVFDTPNDKLVWDVGHQGYPHKILTGRRDTFQTIRQSGGLSGFLDRNESEYDHFGAGHASTSISAALGFAEGMRHKKVDNLSVAIIGDGSMTGGLAFEALNNAGHIPSKNLVVILNDNDMSIDPNVGALNKFVNQALTHPGYNRVRSELRGLLESLDAHGVPVGHLASRMRKSLKNLFSPGMLFECFGFRYFGPIDGHDLDALVETLSFIKNEGPSGPYLVHAITTKGKGYDLAEQLPLKYHGVTSFKVEDGLVSTPKKIPNYQDVFADTLIRIAETDPRVIAITAAMPTGTGIAKFQKVFPDRCYDVGIAEQHGVLFGAGLASEGFRPFVGIYSTFLQRAFDQLVHDVALQKLPVIFAMDRAGCVGADGATHQGQFDLSYLRCIPNFVIMAPSNEDELQHMLYTASQYLEGPIAIRYPRGPVVGVAMQSELKCIPIGQSEFLGSHTTDIDVLLLATGHSVQECLGARAILEEEGLRVSLVNMRFIKPLDEALIVPLIGESKLVTTVEENTIYGGMGSGILELMAKQNCLKNTLNLGMTDDFVQHGSQKAQREQMGIDAKGIAKQCLAKITHPQTNISQRLKIAIKPEPPRLTIH